MSRGNLNGGLANGGLARKVPIGAKRALSGQFLLFPRGCEVRRKGPDRARKGAETLERPHSPPIFSEKFGLKPAFVSPRLDFPNCFVGGFEKGLAGGGWRQTNPKKIPKSFQKCVPILLRRHRKKGTEKRRKSLAFEGLLRANPLCPPTPFRNFWFWQCKYLMLTVQKLDV